VVVLDVEMEAGYLIARLDHVQALEGIKHAWIASEWRAAQNLKLDHGHCQHCARFGMKDMSLG
jgi:hypothetical protein